MRSSVHALAALATAATTMGGVPLCAQDADLVVVGGAYHDPPLIGPCNMLDVYIRNAGADDVIEGFDAQVRPWGSAAAQPVAERVAGIAPGQEISVRFAVGVTEPPVLATVDPLDEVVESNEQNNELLVTDYAPTEPCYTIGVTDPEEVAEGEAAIFVVRRTGSTRGTAAVRYETRNGIAVGSRSCPVTRGSGADYIAARGTLVFENGQTSKVVEIKVCHDGRREGYEDFWLVLSGPSPGVRLPPRRDLLYETGSTSEARVVIAAQSGETRR